MREELEVVPGLKSTVSGDYGQVLPADATAAHLVAIALRFGRERDELLVALKACMAVADRRTIGFNMARAAVAKAERRS